MCVFRLVFMLSVSALSSYVFCPRQFFVRYVLKEDLPPKRVIALGLIKHKVYELVGVQDEHIVRGLLPDHDVHAVFRTQLLRFLEQSVRTHKHALRSAQVPLTDAFQSCLPAVDFEARDRAARVVPLLQKGLVGEQLWTALSPKLKSEYVVKSKNLDLSGRIDRLACYDTSVVPVELKSGKPPQEGVWDGHRLQVAAYAMLLSDHFGVSVGRGVVHYVDAGVQREVVLNPFLRDWVMDIRDACNGILESRQVPQSCGRENCEFCVRFS